MAKCAFLGSVPESKHLCQVFSKPQTKSRYLAEQLNGALRMNAGPGLAVKMNKVGREEISSAVPDGVQSGKM